MFDTAIEDKTSEKKKALDEALATFDLGHASFYHLGKILDKMTNEDGHEQALKAVKAAMTNVFFSTKFVKILKEETTALENLERPSKKQC